MPPSPTAHHTTLVTVHHQARAALFGFIVTFVLARSFVFMIMAGLMPNLYFFVSGTHVHHLNYGILLLSAVGGYSVFRRPGGRAAELAALTYGVAMALTFDEFGMWLHLGGSYWQRTSVDAVILIAAVLGLCAYLRSIERFEKHHKWASMVLLLALIIFGGVVFTAGNRLGELLGPQLEALEQSSSP
jgi:hypothetical protein